MSYLLPIGPFSPALPGPLRLVLRVENETIVDLDYRAGYNERNVAERIKRASLPRALHIVSQICGLDSHAHSMAFCMALEALLADRPHERAVMLRTVAAELERATAHLGAVLKMVELLGLERDVALLGELRGELLECQRLLSGSTPIADYCLPLGVRQDLSSENRELMLLALRRFERGLYRLIDRLIDARGVLRRMVGIGCLSHEAALQYGMRGPVARAAGLEQDLRVDAPYAGYAQLGLRMVSQTRGDAYSRLVLLLLEALESARLVLHMVGELPAGEWLGNALEEVPAGSAAAAVESARGLLRYSLESDGVRLSAVHIDAPRQLDRLLVRTILHHAQVDDLALILASMAPCLACAEG